ncbi:WD40 repeat-like protein [Lophiostoma macrostomum CBS 122681]|uniref:WD40 repeat-like protein n=1 Tax=Lophiostoma macrostomum CBS 122681 TaxID=1314788 RepID=A0A6A6TFM6_9PLEO|nr:WD40 repeat-like protein [Lophiostoma macrostomum CBS 122681]
MLSQGGQEWSPHMRRQPTLPAASPGRYQPAVSDQSWRGQLEKRARFQPELNPDHVLEYLSKKGYVRTEAMLRRESDQIPDPNADSIVLKQVDGGPAKYEKAYDLLCDFVKSSLTALRPSFKKLEWPVFVYSYLLTLQDYYIKDAETFFNKHKRDFESLHGEDIKTLGAIRLPAHLKDSRLAKLYLENRYRISMTLVPFNAVILFLEQKAADEGGSAKVLMELINTRLKIQTVDRTDYDEKTLAAIFHGRAEDELPAEDEGIPGHDPGQPVNATGRDGSKFKPNLGPHPRDADLHEDVRAALQAEDAKKPPSTNQDSLLDEYERRIKREPTEDTQTVQGGTFPPLPPSLARDVSMEVQKIMEHRDRFKIEGRTSGVSPPVSVTMYTFHNTFDSVNCIEFSGDNMLVAAGMAESYIRVWSLEGMPIESSLPDPSTQPSASRRLVGHSGPVYAVAFSPSTVNPDPTGPPTHTQYLLSCSEDKTIRLWSLDTWSCLVAYRGHENPIWDLQWGPFGHYFLTGSHDRTARLWSTEHIEPLRIYVGHDNDVDCVVFHPNNMYVFTGSGDRTVRMWATAGGNCVRIFTGHASNITAIACSPDGKTLASADDHGHIILWNIVDGRKIKRMRGHGKGGIWSLSWSAESTVLVSGGADKTVRVWDAVQVTTESASKGADGAAGKADGTLTVKGTGGAASGAGKKSQKETGVSADQIYAFPTKDSPVYKVAFTRMNLVLAGGAYLPPPKV